MGLADELKYWASSPNARSPLDFLSNEGRNMSSLTDLMGVNKIVPASALKYYDVLGSTSSDVPKTIFINFDNNGRAQETLAHEAEHARQFALPKDKYDALSSFNSLPAITSYVPNGIPGLYKLANSLEGSSTIRSQPTNQELLAFLRGKEATGEVSYKDYSNLHPAVNHWVLKNMFVGQDKFLPPGPNTEFQGDKKPSPSLLDIIRQKMRAFTAY